MCEKLSSIHIGNISRINSTVEETLRRSYFRPSTHMDLDDEENPTTLREKDMFSLSHFQASLFCTVLEDVITQMTILSALNSELQLTKAHVDMNSLLARKFSILQPVIKDELSGVDFNHLDRIEYKINKLDADRKNLKNALITIFLDLTLRKSFRALASYVHAIVDKDDHYKFIMEEEAKNKSIRRELHKQLRQQRNHFRTIYYDTDNIIENLRTEVEDATLVAETHSRYIESWQRARSEQNDQQIKDKESLPMQQIELLKQKSDQEQRVHTEVELLISIAINETLEKVETWMEKYDKDMEGIDLKIQIKKNDYQNILEKRIELEQTLEKHETLMKSWIHFKEEREKARLYREKMTTSAIIVQAWWRGLLVRLQLGPYKVAGKKAGAKKKK